MGDDPIALFVHWYEEACHREPCPDAMSLATADAKGRPSVRVVLYKGISQDGFLFYTNYNSRKSVELTMNPQAAVVFYWPQLYKQVRIEGRVEKLSSEESQAYFQSRPQDSQISAWASEQSREVPSREYLIERYEQYKKKFNTRVDTPDFWGGYRLIPDAIEFWIGHEHRLHERILYKRELGGWKKVFLAP